MSLNDHVVKMEQVILSVEYNQRHLNVWKENNHGYNRFYVTPLCTLETASIKCNRDKYYHDHRHILSFNVKMWDLKAAEIVKLALAQKNITAEISDILPLPMLMVRLGVNQDVTPKISVNKQWRSNQDQPNIIKFEIYTRHEQFCDEMVKDAKADPETFLTGTKMYLEFTMVIGQQASRNLNINGTAFVNSKFFSNLDNKHSGNGIIYLTSTDLNKLSQDIYRTASAQDNVTSTYLPSEQENQIISELFDVIKSQTIHSNDLTTQEQWKSVFWDDIFSRPDVQTEYFNEVLKYDQGEKNFKYNKTNDNRFREIIYNREHREHETKDSGGFEFSFSGFGFGANAADEEKTVTETESNNDVKKNPKVSLEISLTTNNEESENGKSDSENESENDNKKDPENKSGIKLDARYEDTEQSKTENENTYNVTKIAKNTLSLDDLEKHLKKDNVNVKWTGKKFTPKDLLLYRINTKTLKTSGNILYKRIVTTNFQSAQRIEIRPNPENLTHSDNSVSPIFYEEIKNQLNSLKKSFHNSSVDFQNFHNTTFSELEELKNQITILKQSLHNKSVEYETRFVTTAGNCNNQIAAVNQKVINTENKLNTEFQSRLQKMEFKIPPCPTAWSFYELTGFCYKVFRNANWNEAENGCVQNGAHLASIHSLGEAKFVANLAYVPGAELCDGSKQAWIGLSTVGNNLPWQWTDGTPFDYNKWGPNQPDYPGVQNCVKIFTSSNTCNWYLGDFDNLECSARLSSYICKKAPS